MIFPTICSALLANKIALDILAPAKDRNFRSGIDMYPCVILQRKYRNTRASNHSMLICTSAVNQPEVYLVRLFSQIKYYSKINVMMSQGKRYSLLKSRKGFHRERSTKVPRTCPAGVEGEKVSVEIRRNSVPRTHPAGFGGEKVQYYKSNKISKYKINANLGVIIAKMSILL